MAESLQRSISFRSRMSKIPITRSLNFDEVSNTDCLSLVAKSVSTFKFAKLECVSVRFPDLRRLIDLNIANDRHFRKFVHRTRFHILLLWLVCAIGCAVNPVTGVREISLLSPGNEIAMGENDYGPMQQLGGGLYEVDDRVARYVEAVGQRVAAHSDRALPYEFVVVNDSTPNAWALPGGKIGIHRGLLVELDNGAELAAILAHEIVHAAAKHSANQIQRELLMGLFGLGVEYAVNDLGACERNCCCDSDRSVPRES